MFICIDENGSSSLAETVEGCYTTYLEEHSLVALEELTFWRAVELDIQLTAKDKK